jgi:hypothetical protein
VNTAEELLLKISGDSQGGQQAIQQIVGSMDGLKGKSEELAGLLQKAFTDPGAALEQLGTTVTTVTHDSFGGFSEMLRGPVAEGLLGMAAAVAVLGPALYEMGQHATETAAELEKVSLTTGIAVPNLADLKFAVEATGGSFDQLNSLMFAFEQRMDNSAAKVDEGLKLIGLSLADIKAMQPDQAILAISEAMRKAEGGTNLAAAAMDIFGRQGKTALPELLGPLKELADKSRELGGVTAEAAEQAHEFEIKHKEMSLETSRAWTELGLVVAPTSQTISLAWERMKQALANVVLTINDVNTGFGYFHAIYQAFVSDTDKLPKVNENIKGLADGTGLAAKTLQDWNEQVKAMAAHTGPSLDEALAIDREATRDLTEKMKEAHKEEEKRLHDKELYDKALRNLIDSEGGYKTLLEQLGDDTVQAIFYELQHKGAIEDIATVYGVTTTQVRILADEQRTHEKEQTDALTLFSQLHEQTFKLAQQHEKDWRKEQDDALKAANKAVVDMTLATAANWNSYYDDVEKRSLSAKDYQVLKVSEWKDAQLAKFDPARGDWAAYYQSVEALSQEKLTAIEQQHNVLFQDVKGFLTDMTGADGQSGWGKHFFDVLAAGDGFKKGMLAIWDGGEDSIRGRLIKILEQMALDFVNVYIAKAAAALTGWLTGLGGGGGGGLLGLLAGLLGHGGDNKGNGTPIEHGHFDPGTGQWVPDEPSGDSDSSHPPTTDDPNKPPEQHESLGGIIPQYFRRGGFPGYPIGTDTVPTWLTPGEGVLNTRAMARLGTENFERLNAGARPGDLAGGGPRVVQNFYIDGNVWALQDLSRAVAQQLADDFMQIGGGLPLDH